MNKIKSTKGITLISLVVTIIILLILAGVTMLALMGNNGLINRAQDAVEETKEKGVIEKVQLMLADYMTEKYTGTKTLEEYLNEQKANGELDEVTNNGDGTITVEVDGYEIKIKEDNLSIVSTEKAGGTRPTIAETDVSTTLKTNGVIDIVWLDTENNVINEPISPANYLGGLTAIKYNETTKAEETVTAPTSDTSWYHYVAQTGTNDGKTSNWANARSSDSNAYFVWIPRYAYKITYFDTVEHANDYRANNDSKTGIIGYSNIEGMIAIKDGSEKLVTGSEPINVTRRVQTNQYAEYIPHPAFEFDGSKAGIWIGKFEGSGSTSAVKIVPNTNSLRNIKVGDIFTACQGVKNTYSLTSDSHMMKNTEWGAVAYLAESKYGRNGVEIVVNRSNYTTGGGTNDVYKTTNAVQSTTGNVYGIYDMNGTSGEYVAGIVDSKLSNSSYDFTETNSKYYNVYTNYNESKKIKGDGVYETSTPGSSRASWHQGCSIFVNSALPVFVRGR